MRADPHQRFLTPAPGARSQPPPQSAAPSVGSFCGAELPEVRPILERVFLQSPKIRSPGPCRVVAPLRIRFPRRGSPPPPSFLLQHRDNRHMPTHKPDDNTIAPGGARLPKK